MLQPGQLAAAFAVYNEDIDRARRGGAYWSLLHVVVCLPDICGALGTPNGEAGRAPYIEWCDRYLPHPLLSGAERYRMRCKVLHQGRATPDRLGRYDRFSFGQPANGSSDHMRVDGRTLHLDVGCLVDETLTAIARWAPDLELNPSSSAALNAARHLPTLVRVTQAAVPLRVGSRVGQPLVTVVNKTS